jgi:LacI family transcriptional regulator
MFTQGDSGLLRKESIIIMKLTIKEIAKMANVTTTTVSRVINNKPDVKPETRELITRLIKKYNFQPNVFAKGISSQKSNCIALVIPHKESFILMNPFYSEFIRGISSEFNKRGYFLLFCYVNQKDCQNTEEYLVNIFIQKRVDGFILLTPSQSSGKIVDSLKKAGAPFVLTCKMIGQLSDFVYVDSDNYQGARLATEHLIALGHRKIALINGTEILKSSEERFESYYETLLKHNIPFDDSLVKTGGSTLESGYVAMNELLNSKNRPTAVFIVADVMAMGAIRAIWEGKLRIPEDISIVGFDDIPEAEYMNPPLTTIRQPTFDKGKKAANLIIRLLDKKMNVKSVTFGVELVVRNSTAAPQKTSG